MRKEYGPTLPISKEIHEMKYRGEGETFEDCVNRQSSTLADDDQHRKAYTDILLNQRYMPAGRVQSAVGSPKVVTPWNCFVSGDIKDDFDDIMVKAHEAGRTMRLGGGIGYDFSPLRPRGGLIKSLDSQSSGPISFMDIFNSVCGTISSSGHRRGAQMAVLRVDHPDIIEFIHAKRNSSELTKFNISVGVTDEFMEALKKGKDFDLRFNGQVYNTVNANYLWNEIMRSTWDWAEPGVLYIDRINEENNLWYCETIKTTNPCQPGWAKVLTPEGVREFSEISEGDKIWSKDGWTTVVKKWSTGVKPVYRYETTSGTFYGTENHRVVSDGEKVEVKNAETIDACKGPSQKSEIDVKDVMDGMVIGDGMIHKASNNLVLLCIGENDYDYFNSEVSVLINNNRKGIADYAYEVDSTIKYDELSETYNRKIPERFIRNPKKAVGFLRGLFSANGSVVANGERVTLKASSKTIIDDVQLMLSSLGINSYYTTNKSKSVKFSNGDYVCRESYDINITSDRDKFCEIIGFIQKYKEDKIKFPKNKNLGKKSFDIKDVEFISEEEVFDITVDNESHTYWTQGCDVSNCGEQPLPPYGACLLGSFNLTKYVNRGQNGFTFDFEYLAKDVPYVVRAMDNIIDEGVYPLPQQEKEGKDKRRMGLGITGTANAIEACGFPYASDGYINFQNRILETIRDESYRASIELAKEKGPFPLFDAEKYCQSKFIKRLPQDIQDDIYKYGIRNSHLTSVAPTGTISLSADNISSGIEPVFTYSFERTIQTFDGPVFEEVSDFGYREWGIEGVKAMDIDVEDHVKVLNATQKFVDSACSKTCNVGDDVSWERFKDVYMKAYEGGAKGCTTFRVAGKRYGILNEKKEEQPETEEGEYIDDEDSVEACTFDAKTGQPTCS